MSSVNRGTCPECHGTLKGYQDTFGGNLYEFIECRQCGVAYGVQQVHSSMLKSASQSLAKPKPELISVGEAARLLNVHANTLRRWTQDNVVRAYRVGNRHDRRYKREEVMDLLGKRVPA